MAAHPATLLVAAFVLAGLAACEEKAAPIAEPPAPTATTAPDRSAPAPGTQAAEAIGSDSSSDPGVAPH